MKKYDLSRIMSKAWALFRKLKIAFGECLHRAWMAAKAAPINAARIEAAKAAAGITEEAHSWYGWKRLGFEVQHGARCLFQAVVIAAEKGDGKTTTKSYFGASQVRQITAAA